MMSVKDFVLLDYVSHEYNPMRLPLLRQAVSGLGAHHPGCTVHLLTNATPPAGLAVQVHLRRNLAMSHYAKLSIFDLIDRPFFYLDTDVLVNRPFEETHARCLGDAPFNAYATTHFCEKSGFTDLLNFRDKTKQRLSLSEGVRYNSGVMFVRDPSPSLRGELAGLESVFDPEYYTKSGGSLKWACDELPLSYLIASRGWRMGLASDVGVWHEWLGGGDVRQPQSTHFSGTGKGRLVRMVSPARSTVPMT